MKGSSFADLLPQMFALSVFAVVFNLWAVFSFKKNK